MQPANRSYQIQLANVASLTHFFFFFANASLSLAASTIPRSFELHWPWWMPPSNACWMDEACHRYGVTKNRGGKNLIWQLWCKCVTPLEMGIHQRAYAKDFLLDPMTLKTLPVNSVKPSPHAYIKPEPSFLPGILHFLSTDKSPYTSFFCCSQLLRGCQKQERLWGGLPPLILKPNDAPEEAGQEGRVAVGGVG